MDDLFDAYAIQEIECSTATQPFAISVESPHAQTISRLFQEICSAKSQDLFAANGFVWQLPAKGMGSNLKNKPAEGKTGPAEGKTGPAGDTTGPADRKNGPADRRGDDQGTGQPGATAGRDGQAS
jgi:hypothetical protein